MVRAASEVVPLPYGFQESETEIMGRIGIGGGGPDLPAWEVRATEVITFILQIRKLRHVEG